MWWILIIKKEAIEFEIVDSGNLNWMPGELKTESYWVELPEKIDGKYNFAIQLFDKTTGRIVDIGLLETIKTNNYFTLTPVSF